MPRVSSERSVDGRSTTKEAIEVLLLLDWYADVLEGDDTFYLFASKDARVLPLHKCADVAARL